MKPIHGLQFDSYTVPDLREELHFYREWEKENLCPIMQVYIERRMDQLLYELEKRKKQVKQTIYTGRGRLH